MQMGIKWYRLYRMIEFLGKMRHVQIIYIIICTLAGIAVLYSCYFGFKPMRNYPRMLKKNNCKNESYYPVSKTLNEKYTENMIYKTIDHELKDINKNITTFVEIPTIVSSWNMTFSILIKCRPCVDANMYASLVSVKNPIQTMWTSVVSHHKNGSISLVFADDMLYLEGMWRLTITCFNYSTTMAAEADIDMNSCQLVSPEKTISVDRYVADIQQYGPTYFGKKKIHYPWASVKMFVKQHFVFDRMIHFQRQKFNNELRNNLKNEIHTNITYDDLEFIQHVNSLTICKAGDPSIFSRGRWIYRSRCKNLNRTVYVPETCRVKADQNQSSPYDKLWVQDVWFWQPDHCNLRLHTPPDVSTCLNKNSGGNPVWVAFIGDSLMRNNYYEFCSFLEERNVNPQSAQFREYFNYNFDYNHTRPGIRVAFHEQWALYFKEQVFAVDTVSKCLSEYGQNMAHYYALRQDKIGFVKLKEILSYKTQPDFILMNIGIHSLQAWFNESMFVWTTKQYLDLLQDYNYKGTVIYRTTFHKAVEKNSYDKRDLFQNNIRIQRYDELVLHILKQVNRSKIPYKLHILNIGNALPRRSDRVYDDNGHIYPANKYLHKVTAFPRLVSNEFLLQMLNFLCN